MKRGTAHEQQHSGTLQSYTALSIREVHTPIKRLRKAKKSSDRLETVNQSTVSGGTCKQGHAVESALQLPQQDVDEAVPGERARVLSALIIHHHFLFPAQVHLRKGRGQRSEVRR